MMRLWWLCQAGGEFWSTSGPARWSASVDVIDGGLAAR
jgi:hypothetical protein